jgi:hypothetical protein
MPAFAGMTTRVMIIYFALFLSGVLISPPAHAARFTGAYLLDMCNMDDKGRETVEGGHTACQGYIAGVIDYHAVLQSMKIAPAIDICIPQDVKMYDLHRIVLKYLRKHPEHDNFTAAPAVTMGLYEKYPCPKGKKKKKG